MPLQKVRFRPTFFADSTTYAAEGSWRMGDKVRFRDGLPETIGGWRRYNSSMFLGVCRSLIAWRTLASERLIGLGTHLKYYLERGGAYYDITPVRATTTPTDPFATLVEALASPISAVDTQADLVSATNLPVSGRFIVDAEEITWSAKAGNTLLGLQRGVNGTTPTSHSAAASVRTNVVRVTDSAHGASTGDFITVASATAVGGVSAALLNAEHQITVEGLSVYFFSVDAYATSAATGGGAPTIDYQVVTGLPYFTQGVGWGAGGWGQGGWGGPAAVGIGQQMRIWSHQNFGEDLIFGPRGGGIYYWDASAGFATRGVLLSTLPGAVDVPTVQNRLLVTESRFVIAFGTNPLGDTVQDPMLIRWSDQELPQFWTPTTGGLAGDLRLAIGSGIVTAVSTQQEVLVWTDSALYSLQFAETLGFVQKLIADNISIAGPNAVVVANNVVYWMGKDKFYRYTGRSETLVSTVDQYVFDDYNQDQTYQVYAGVNESFDEVWWFYVSGNSMINDRYVVYSYVEDGWVVGNMPRTAWLGSGMLSRPVSTNNERLFEHEYGVDDGTDNVPVAMVSWLESADFGVGDGEFYAFVSRVLPDITFARSTSAAPTANFTLAPRVASGAPYRPEGSSPYVVRVATAPVEQYTEQVYLRVRGRQMKLRVDSNTVGTAWRLGVPRLDIKPNGRKA